MDTGETLFNALLALGWDVEVDDVGHISATQGDAIVRAEVCDDGHIQWDDADRDLFDLRQMRILELRERAKRVRADRNLRELEMLQP